MNPLQLIPHGLSPHDLKATGASALAILATVGEGVASPAGWESLGLKTCLVLAIIYLVREGREQRKAAEAAAVEAKLLALAREEKMSQVLAANTEAKSVQTAKMEELRAEVALQTSYFKTITQQIVNATIHPKLPE